MITEIELAQKLSTINDPLEEKNIISSGRVRGINIYNKNVNIMIEQDKNNDQNNIDIVKNGIAKLLGNIKDIETFKVDVSQNTGNKSDLSQVVKMSKLKKNNKKISDKWNMDSHKLFWHLDRVEAWKKGERIAPLHIDMGISSGCNMACTFCYGVIQNRDGFGTNSKKIFHMPTSAVKRTFKEAKEIGVKSIALIGEGENTLHPDFYEILSYGKEIGLDLSLATNGIKIDHSKLDIILSSLKWIRFNISAGTKETFEKIHRVKQMDRVLGNAKALTELKKKKNYECVVGFQMVVTKENMNDIVPLAKLGKECGVDYFVVKPCSDTYDSRLDSPKGEYIEILDIFKEAENYSSQGYTVNVKWQKVLNGGWKDYDSCHGTQFILGLSGRGDLFPCGHWFNERKDEFLMGNVIDKSFKEIWLSERYWEVQEKIRKHVNVNKDCESNCRQHYINRFLFFDGKKSLTDTKKQYKEHIAKKPNHINFI
jgi:radical SAM protein with 4Fe4S-binding SPASM domain